MAEYDVIVIGGGNAALCAALAARHVVSRVLLLERAPVHMRGGNTRHTRNIRCSHSAADQFFSGPYSEQEHLEDLVGVTGGPANLDLAKLAVRESSKLPAWMSAHYWRGYSRSRRRRSRGWAEARWQRSPRYCPRRPG